MLAMSRRPSFAPRIAVPARGGHHFVGPAPESPEGSPSVSVDASVEAAWVEGRHPIITASMDDGVLAGLAHDFMRLSGDVLSSVGVGVGQRIATGMCPPPVLQKQELPGNRGDHVGMVRARFTAYAFQIEALTTNINQLIALEHVMTERLLILESDLERHEATEDFVCLDCELVLDAADQRQSRAAVQRALDTREEAIARARVGLRPPFNSAGRSPAPGVAQTGARR